MNTRLGEFARTRFRSDRFYLVDAKYYFSTREGQELGPFYSKNEASLGLERYIRCINEGSELNIKSASQIALQGNWAVSHYKTL